MNRTATADFSDAWLGPLLVEAGIITAERLNEMSATVDTAARLWIALVRGAVTDDDAIVGELTKRFRFPAANLTQADSRLVSMLPEVAARRYHVVVLGADERSIRLATSDPRDYAAEQELGFLTGRDVRFEVAPPMAIGEKLDELYRPENSINRLLSGLEPAGIEIDIDEAPADMGRDPALDAPMAKLVDAMLADSVRTGASDVHAEIESGHVIVRYRIDGVLREVMRLPEASGPALVRRVKIVAGLDVTNSMIPQDGRSSVRVDGQAIDMRVATAPVARRGEKLVIRILDQANLKTSVGELLLPADEEEPLLRMLGHREGMVLVTGPTGSGKTTTLYAVLNHLKTGRVNIVTVEDPVEYDVNGISQLQINEAQDFTFATALRSVLRQDPDIVLVGEIRDPETASIAIQAGLTGHLVFSTLHTNDAVSAVVRLRDMGVDLFKISTVLKGVVAQRLVRRLCQHCAEPHPVDELPAALQPPEEFVGVVAPMRSIGCKRCNGTGYRGRVAVVELLPIEGKVAKLIENDAPLEQVLAAARPHGMKTLRESGMHRFWTGVTSLDEIQRVLGDAHDTDGSEGGATAPIVSPEVTRGRGTAAEDGSGATILLADDDAQMRRLVRTVLERDGFTVIESADGLDTLDAIDTKSIDLVLLDHDMPRLTGLGVLEELRARVTTAGLPVIMLTARTDDTETLALELGAQDYLTKPVQPRSLVARVRAVLKRSRME